MKNRSSLMEKESKMTKKGGWRTLSIFYMISVLCLITGCTTSIPVTYTEPAKLNLSGVKRIAISANDEQVANNISQRLSATGVYTIASAAELAEWEQWFPLGSLQATATEVKATDLISAYKANEARADSIYAGKLLKISGTVSEIRSLRGAYFARINIGNDSIAIFFARSELNKLTSIDKGQTITAIGINHGFKMPDMEDTAEILRILGAGERINIANATFPAGEYPGKIDAIIKINKDSRVQDSSRNETRSVVAGKDEDGKDIRRNVNVTIYERTVATTIAYQIVRALNGSTIGQGTKTATSSKSSSEDPAKLASASQLESNIIGKPLQEFANEIVPVKRSINLTLAKSDDNRAKNEMSEAEKLAKSKDYTGAAAAYGKIYAQYGNFAAGYNQSILTEASDGTGKAIELMTALIQKFNDNSTAKNTLAEMQRREMANQQSAQQLSR